jgi:hypothetical protein
MRLASGLLMISRPPAIHGSIDAAMLARPTQTGYIAFSANALEELELALLIHLNRSNSATRTGGLKEINACLGFGFLEQL